MKRVKWYALLTVSFFLLILLLGSCGLNIGSSVAYKPTSDPAEFIDRIVQASNSWKDADGQQCNILLEYPGLIFFVAPKLGIYRVAYEYYNEIEDHEEWSITPWMPITADFRQFMDMRRNDFLEVDPYDKKPDSPWNEEALDSLSRSG